MTIIYIPIHLRDLGMSWGDIGLVLTVMLVPFVLLQYPVGLLADKFFGERRMLIHSILLLGVSTVCMAFVSIPSVGLWMIVLLFSRIGAAFVEILRDSYFYKQIDGRDVNVIYLFRTARPMGYIVAALLSGALLAIFPREVLFFVLGLVVFSGFIPAFLLPATSLRKGGFFRLSRDIV
ncbi:MAG: MFS transporter [Candidatus Moranbacteria bacterium]|nr:MFS transporter [Candidatus Moranbacteria bacterium]